MIKKKHSSSIHNGFDIKKSKLFAEFLVIFYFFRIGENFAVLSHILFLYFIFCHKYVSWIYLKSLIRIKKTYFIYYKQFLK